MVYAQIAKGKWCMAKLNDIKIVVESGQKYTNSYGVTAIKDGVKKADHAHERLPKPPWLRQINTITPTYLAVKDTVRAHHADGRDMHTRLSVLCGGYG